MLSWGGVFAELAGGVGCGPVCMCVHGFMRPREEVNLALSGSVGTGCGRKIPPGVAGCDFELILGVRVSARHTAYQLNCLPFGTLLVLTNWEMPETLA